MSIVEGSRTASNRPELSQDTNNCAGRTNSEDIQTRAHGHRNRPVEEGADPASVNVRMPFDGRHGQAYGPRGILLILSGDDRSDPESAEDWAGGESASRRSELAITWTATREQVAVTAGAARTGRCLRACTSLAAASRGEAVPRSARALAIGWSSTAVPDHHPMEATSAMTRPTASASSALRGCGTGRRPREVCWVPRAWAIAWAASVQQCG